MDRMRPLEEIPRRRHVQEASFEGFVAAIDVPEVRDSFAWELDADNPPWLLFLGTHQGHFRRADVGQNFHVTQDTWFEFSASRDSLKYVMRLVDHPEGDSRAIFEASVSLEEGADLLEMCIEQVLAAHALKRARLAEQVAGLAR